jgi:hypothetical protein
MIRQYKTNTQTTQISVPSIQDKLLSLSNYSDFVVAYMCKYIEHTEVTHDPIINAILDNSFL